MADLAGIALSGLRASQTSLSTTSHNIVNVDTEGYSRQKTGLGTRVPQSYGGSFIGQGVDVESITRVSNQYVVDQLRRDVASYNSFDAYYEYAVRVDQLLGDDSTAITPSMQSFFDAMQDVSNDPASIPSRQVLISSGQALVNRFNAVYEQVYQTNETLNIELDAVASKITQLGESIAAYNQSIQAVYTNNTGELPNDLLDQRDEAIRQLSELVGVEVLQQQNLSVSIFVGSGQPLVIGNESFSVETVTNDSGLSRKELVITDGTNVQNITNLVSGGRLSGLLTVREELIDPVFNELGRMALSVAQTFNDQHQLGMDLDNQLGGLFFGDINSSAAEFSRIASDTANAGTAALSVTIDDTNLLTAEDYRLRFDSGSGNYTLFNADGTVNATFADPGPGGVFATTDGFTLNFVSGAPADGDEFTVLPTRLGAFEMSMEVTDVRQVAAAMPVTTNLPSTNTGGGFVEEVVVADTTTADFTTTPFALTPAYRVEFTSATTYDVVNAGTNAIVAGGVAFTPGQSNGLLEQAGLFPASGYDVVFNGNPGTNDIVEIDYNNGGVNDNRNALLLGELSSTKTIANGTVTFQGAYGQLVSGVGTRTNDAAVSQEAAETILNQSQAQWESISGVNLDEEAANLIRFQQSYQASARVIQVSSELFDTIISSL
ncbi:MAG: flagellar hook-associated protein FlgK [Pseudomonadales bacterium]|uniref:flagellar hook-associated protein FlgK n=1 Tax=unclassified Ketobacter TaxID=2639109 RepID=UPI000C3D60DC|nr:MULTISPECIES: flagellar hook-associated protein FlgK [unclassified Ketobacter]MAQ24989.1 flagellar hook-associated protein FlgK [Pseudomonadales bacterium]MEC8810548.1 flagellar hook-associated protein FlgK [Pseudomonadota bacterium]MBI26839.1 flagellar hook-associated protein FlgK [Pseudomonadales bacterium]RLT88614.1 MAG: flagellar hook-associated protein FlgK [Ketobacter sp. GenoA1]RLT97785.1 MAG: flagellar hook-associated protein FlgK [Ketobacter sp.]|tara:strand:+ start:57525 stop:59507 length:1983 start_codon:yes stop_codon:yes gene_type:complete